MFPLFPLSLPDFVRRKANDENARFEQKRLGMNPIQPNSSHSIGQIFVHPSSPRAPQATSRGERRGSTVGLFSLPYSNGVQSGTILNESATNIAEIDESHKVKEKESFGGGKNTSIFHFSFFIFFFF